MSHTQKKYYMDVINILVPLNIFAGGFTLATQFVLPCSATNLQSLLTLASELFIGSLFALTLVFLLIYGFWDDDDIEDPINPGRYCGLALGRHSLVVVQIIIIGIMMIAAFFVLGAAIIQAGNHWVGGFGIGLIFILALGAVWIGRMLGRNGYAPVAVGPLNLVPIHHIQRNFTDNQGVALIRFFILEILIIVLLIAFGIWQSIDPPEKTCDATSTYTLQWPTSTQGFSEVGSETSPLNILTEIDTILSFTLTDIDTIQQLETFSTIISTITFTKTISTKEETSNSVTAAFSSSAQSNTLSTTLKISTASTTQSKSSLSSLLSSSQSIFCRTCTAISTGIQNFTTLTITSTIPCTT